MSCLRNNVSRDESRYCGHDPQFELHQHLQSVPITTTVVSWNPTIASRGVLDTTACYKVCQ